LPASPITCGMAISAGENPDRAHTGNGLTGGCPAHPSEVTTSAWPVPAWNAFAGVALAPAGG
jgi:hypothetical protein